MASIATPQCWMRAERDSHITVQVARQPLHVDPGSVMLDVDVSVGFTGQVVLSGPAGENLAGWRVGFVQLKHTTTEWAEYRGLTASDGSIFAAMDRPPARMQQLCLDCDGTHRPFYGEDFLVTRPDVEMRTDSTFVFAANVVMPAGGSMEVIVTNSDAPHRPYDAALPNTAFPSPRPNYLHALESRAAFVTLLTVKDPQGRFHLIKHMYWNIVWQAHFRWDARLGQLRVERQDGGVHVQRQAHSGVPDDPRFEASLRNVPAADLSLCNPLAQAAFRNPARLRYAQQWQVWPVAR